MPEPTWPMFHNSWTTLYFHSPRKKLPSTSIHHTPSLIEPYCWQMAEMLTWRRVVLLILVLFATMVGSWLYQLWEALPPNGVSAAVPSIFINTTIILFETMVLKFWATLTIQYQALKLNLTWFYSAASSVEKAICLLRQILASSTLMLGTTQSLHLSACSAKWESSSFQEVVIRYSLAIFVEGLSRVCCRGYPSVN